MWPVGVHDTAPKWRTELRQTASVEQLRESRQNRPTEAALDEELDGHAAAAQHQAVAMEVQEIELEEGELDAEAAAAREAEAAARLAAANDGGDGVDDADELLF